MSMVAVAAVTATTDMTADTILGAATVSDIYDQVCTIIGDALQFNGSGIYEIRLIGTERRYVGRSVGVGGRLFTHVKQLMLNTHCNRKLQNAWNKYGPDRFAFKVMQKVDGAALADAEQAWINNLQAASVGFNIVAHVDPYLPIDGTDPNVIKYRQAMPAVSLAITVAQCSKLRGNKRRATLEDCLRWNAYAISMLGAVPPEMVKDRVKKRLNTALDHANQLIKKSGDAAMLPYIDAPGSYPHDALIPQTEFDEVANEFGIVVSQEWWKAAMTVAKERAAAIVGIDEMKRQWRAVTSGKIGDGNFIEWCREIGVQYPPASSELRALGLVTWELV